MRKLKLDNYNQISLEDINYLGGTYSFIEKFHLGGVGSPKLIYKSGVEEFDILIRDVEGEIAFVNFELFKEGLVIYFNVNQRLEIIGLQLHELKSITLFGTGIEIQKPSIGGYRTKMVFKGNLEIKTKYGSILLFVPVSVFNGLQNYFRKQIFDYLFTYKEV